MFEKQKSSTKITFTKHRSTKDYKHNKIYEKSFSYSKKTPMNLIKEFIINTYYRIRYFSKRSRINND